MFYRWQGGSSQGGLLFLLSLVTVFASLLCQESSEIKVFLRLNGQGLILCILLLLVTPPRCTLAAPRVRAGVMMVVEGRVGISSKSKDKVE